MKTTLITLALIAAHVCIASSASLNAKPAEVNTLKEKPAVINASKEKPAEVKDVKKCAGKQAVKSVLPNPTVKEHGKTGSQLAPVGRPAVAHAQTAVFDLTPEHPAVRIIIHPGKEDPEIFQLDKDDDEEDRPASLCGYNGDARFKSCSDIYKAFNGSAPSGEYKIWIPRLHTRITVYCEMGLNGGGYTFINPFNLPCLTDADIKPIFTEKSSFLLRVRHTDGSQPYGVLSQLSNTHPLQLSLSNYAGYTRPVNVDALGGPYMYYGFIPANVANVQNAVQGIKVNGASVTFSNCDANPNSYIALFPNYGEKTPSTYGTEWGVFAMTTQFVQQLKPVPSRRVMPMRYFMFLEMHHGGCGMFTQTDGRPGLTGILSASIGFR